VPAWGKTLPWKLVLPAGKSLNFGYGQPGPRESRVAKLEWTIGGNLELGNWSAAATLVS